ncbi:hypothetical protein OYC64_020096 [Pagothenia borchgrevinki]|uniref:Uncharacterized protein n=1 Tax=Pagothenia borchgrevinki TaxID=8213 RepID=A0ABD2FKI9_PAGBO
MDSPAERPCPSCPGSIEGDDPDTRCIECLGSDHAAANLTRSSRLHRVVVFEGCYVSPVEDPELNVVEMEDLEQGVPFVFAIPAARTGPGIGEGDDDDDTSSSGSSADRQEGHQQRSARQDFSAVMARAAERAGLPLPPPIPPRPVSHLRQGFYGPGHPAQPAPWYSEMTQMKVGQPWALPQV